MKNLQKMGYISTITETEINCVLKTEYGLDNLLSVDISSLNEKQLEVVNKLNEINQNYTQFRFGTAIRYDLKSEKLEILDGDNIWV